MNPGDSKGYCPNCKDESQPGTPGELCKNPTCAAKGYHLIPEEYYRLLKEHPKKNNELLGQLIDNRYLLVKVIGVGGMGVVYLGLQKPFMREVAVKVVSTSIVDTLNVERFTREARALSLLDHPNIVKLLDYGVHRIEAYGRELPYMVLEYVKGGIELGRFFKEMKKAGKQVSNKLVVHIFSQLLNALETAHSQGLIHRDIKPSNILLKKVTGNPFMVKLLDFGLAKALTESEGFGSEQTLTKEGMLLGTPQYLAPEQGDIRMLYEGRIDGRADLYSVGVILYEVLTGVKPFPFKDTLKILVMKTSDIYDPFKVPAARALPEPVRRFLQKAMARFPQDRFQSAREFRRAMKEVLLSNEVGIKGLETSDLDSTSSELKDVGLELVELATSELVELAYASPSSHSQEQPVQPPPPPPPEAVS